MEFKRPPITHNEQGQLRTVGFELEYANLGINTAVQLIQELYGGQVQRESRFKQHVRHTRLGDFTVEFDLTLLSEKRYKKVFSALHIDMADIKIGSGTLEDEVETALESVVGKVFPYEIACPPIACTQLQELEPLREALFRHKAEGTASFPTNAFGTHINTEVPATDEQTLLNYLRAMVLLYPWLLQEGKTDLARKISPFIDPFPEDYVNLLLIPAYAPDLEELISDYHLYNPDRNRPLDMYPLFAALCPRQVNKYKDVGKVKPRRTFHYRLPNSSVSQPGWTLAEEWNHWVAVEELAFDHDKLKTLSLEYMQLKDRLLLGFEAKWIKRIERWFAGARNRK